VHKAANVLDKMPRSVQPAAKADLREIRQAPDRAAAEAAIASFAEKYGPSTRRQRLREGGAACLGQGPRRCGNYKKSTFLSNYCVRNPTTTSFPGRWVEPFRRF
jgi:hypothetical protein